MLHPAGQLAAQATGEQALPTVYLRLAGEEGGADRFVLAYLLRCRANGFMLLLPDVDHVDGFVEVLVNDEDEPLALTPQSALGDSPRSKPQVPKP